MATFFCVDCIDYFVKKTVKKNVKLYINYQHLHFILKISTDLFGSLALTLSAQLLIKNVSEFVLKTDVESNATM